MSTATILVNTDPALKESAGAALRDMGLDFSTAILGVL